MTSKKIIVAADGTVPAANVSDASVTDILTSIISSDTVVTGTYGLVQRAGLFLAGMMYGNKRHSGTWTNFG